MPYYPETRREAVEADLAWHVRRERINSQGYTASGSYYGLGEPLYYCYNAQESVRFRADDREHAIEQLRDHMRPHPVHLYKEH